jgi:SagB-type dehydrogenase family enzyme
MYLKRFTASAGNLGSAEVYFIATDIVDFRPGLYHYLPATKELECLVPGDHSRAVEDWIGFRPIGLFILVGAIERQISKYERRGYLYCLLDAGLMAHRIELLARAQGLRTSTHGVFPDQAVIEYLNLDPHRLAPCAMVSLIGQRSPENGASI